MSLSLLFLLVSPPLLLPLVFLPLLPSLVFFPLFPLLVSKVSLPSKVFLMEFLDHKSKKQLKKKTSSLVHKTRKMLPLLVIQMNANFQLFHSVLILAMVKKLLIPPFPLDFRMSALMEAQNCPQMILREASLLFKRKKRKSLKKKKKKKTKKKRKKVKRKFFF